MPDKVLVFRTQKEQLQLNNKKGNSHILKMGKCVNTYFFKETVLQFLKMLTTELEDDQ